MITGLGGEESLNSHTFGEWLEGEFSIQDSWHTSLDQSSSIDSSSSLSST